MVLCIFLFIDVFLYAGNWDFKRLRYVPNLKSQKHLKLAQLSLSQIFLCACSKFVDLMVELGFRSRGKVVKSPNI